MSEHTPKPWFVATYPYPPTLVMDGQGRAICTTAGYSGNTREAHAFMDQAEANATEIVHRWNVHDALLAAVNDLKGIIQDAQTSLALYLPPDGITEQQLINALLELFDGPRQREVERVTLAAIKQAEGPAS